MPALPVMERSGKQSWVHWSCGRLHVKRVPALVALVCQGILATNWKDTLPISVAERSLFAFFNVFEVFIQPLTQPCLDGWRQP